MCTKQSLHGQKFSLKLIFINKKRKENVSLKHLSRISVTDPHDSYTGQQYTFQSKYEN
jgi:hypothetical protein